MEWQPIESAPGNSVSFLAWDGLSIQVCKLLKGEIVLSWNHEPYNIDGCDNYSATHWMPLPPAPETNQ